jgi:hypothetical protein
LKILDIDQASTTFKASMLEIEESLETWPQLGSAVMLGGAVITDAARRILLGQLQGSGRFYIDLETLLQREFAMRLSKPGILSKCSQHVTVLILPRFTCPPPMQR